MVTSLSHCSHFALIKRSMAAIHQNSDLKTDSGVLQTIDMTANTDFDFDASPAQTVDNGVALNRAYLTAAFASMA